MRTDYNKLKAKIDEAYYSCPWEYPQGKITIDSAKKIFKKIKNLERLNGGDKVDYENELREAKFDLVEIFGMSYEELKGLNRNNLYLTHQSKIVNGIYIMNNKGE